MCGSSIVETVLRWCQAEYVRGHWQRPTWQGRFAGSGAAGAADDGLVIAWLLLERAPEPGGASATPPADDCAGSQ